MANRRKPARPNGGDRLSVGQRPRRFGGCNWVGLATLLRRGMQRYFRSATEGVLGAIISAMLFLSVFAFALPEGYVFGPGIEPINFLLPGLAAMTGFHNAFENAAFSTIYDKLEGMIGDLLMAPLKPWELIVASIASSALGGLFTGTAVLLVGWLFVDLSFQQAGLSLLFACLGTVLFATIGFITGLWAEKWDRFSMISTFLVLPLGMLSGSFFSLDSLPPLGQTLLVINPVFYLIDGVRGGLAGYNEGALEIGLPLLAALTLVLLVLAHRLLSSGYKVKP
jgi:ABC-2 type transport system permease protein|tara:strand:+ start:4096 stop:4938 length:843 start_codon:yes stop_codon:yes gene_type:complete